MKKGTKFLMTASMFAVVMNMNGCGAYGAPPDFFEPSWNMDQPAYGVPYYEVTPVPTTAPTEADWYKLTKRNYAVIRITSVPEPVQDGEDAVQNVIYGIEVLAFYAADGADLSSVTMLSVPKKDSLLFDEGYIVFAELGLGIQQDDALIYPLLYDAYGPVYTGFPDGKLETAGFDNHKCYRWLWDFNAYLEWNYVVNPTEESKEEPVYFDDGMAAEDAVIFFDSLRKAKAEAEAEEERE